MLIDRTHKPWFVASALVVTIAASAYWVTAKHSLHGPSGGSVFGLMFGIAGSLLMVFAALLAVRKRLPTWRVGSAQFWLRGHLWLGTLGFVLILFHAGFKWGGLLENLLWVSFGLVVVTGFAGVALQQVIPRLLTTRVPLETIVAQIPFLSKTMLFCADQLIAKQTGVLNVDYEPLKPFAEEALKQQRVLKRESDFPKELAKVYANVPLPEADAKKPHAPAPAEIVNTKSAPSIPTQAATPSVGETIASPAAEVPAAKPKSPLELMREKAAAKAAAGDAAAPTPENPSAPPVAAPEKKLSPLEQMKAKQAAAKAATEPAAASPIPVAEPAAPETEKKLSPLEQMKAKMAAKAAVPVSPSASPASEAPVVTATEKKLSPLEQMQAKLAAKKAAPNVDAADIHKPLTAEKPVSVAKPSVEKPVAVTPPKPKVAAPIPPALLAELRDFHVRIIRSFLSTGRSPQHRMDDHISARRVFAQLRSDLPAELHDSIQQLEDLCEERRQFNTQLRLHRWLHWWLILHIPPSIALLVLFVAHVIVSLRVVPFGR